MTSPKTVTPDQPQAVPDLTRIIRDLRLHSNSYGHSIPPTTRVLMEAAAEALAARPVLPAETPAEGLREAVAVSIWRAAATKVTSRRLVERRTLDAFKNATSELRDYWLRQADAALATLASTAPAPLSGRDGSLREADLEAWVFHMLVGHDELMALHSNSEDRFDEQRDTARGIVAEIRRRAALAAVPPETAEMEGEADNFTSADDFEEMCDALDIKPDAEHWKILCEMEIAARKAAEVKAERAAEDERDRLYDLAWTENVDGGDEASFLQRQGAMSPADRLAARASSSGEAGDE